MTNLQTIGNILGGIGVMAIASPFVIGALCASGWIIMQMMTKGLPKFLEALDDAKKIVKAYLEHNK